jgi:hypothetical protein
MPDSPVTKEMKRKMSAKTEARTGRKIAAGLAGVGSAAALASAGMATLVSPGHVPPVTSHQGQAAVQAATLTADRETPGPAASTAPALPGEAPIGDVTGVNPNLKPTVPVSPAGQLPGTTTFSGGGGISVPFNSDTGLGTPSFFGLLNVTPQPLGGLSTAGSLPLNFNSSMIGNFFNPPVQTSPSLPASSLPKTFELDPQPGAFTPSPSNPSKLDFSNIDLGQFDPALQGFAAAVGQQANDPAVQAAAAQVTQNMLSANSILSTLSGNSAGSGAPSASPGIVPGFQDQGVQDFLLGPAAPGIIQPFTLGSNANAASPEVTQAASTEGTQPASPQVTQIAMNGDDFEAFSMAARSNPDVAAAFNLPKPPTDTGQPAVTTPAPPPPPVDVPPAPAPPVDTTPAPAPPPPMVPYNPGSGDSVGSGS